MKVQTEAAKPCSPFTYQTMMDSLAVLSSRYSSLSLGIIGESVLGRSIPVLTIGKGEKALLCVGAHSGTDWLASQLLIRYAEDLLSHYENGAQAFRYSIPYLLSVRTIYIIPMLNPDGVEYVCHGVGEENVLYERVRAMNGGSEDFSDWRGNARGVELSRNYAYGFSARKQMEGRAGILGGGKSGFSGEMPESEPETAALCRFLRYRTEIRGVLSLDQGAEGILHTAGGRGTARSSSIAKAIARMTSYPLRAENDLDADGAFASWCIDALNIPAFSVGFGTAMGEGNAFWLYTVLREALFTMPTMI